MHYRKCGASVLKHLCVCFVPPPVINLQLIVIYGVHCFILLTVVINYQFVRLPSSGSVSDLNDKSCTVTNACGNACYS